MNDHFPGYYHPSEREFAKLWRSCIFVIDASVLLNLYRYPKQAREDLLKVLKRISNRLWLPHQAAIEYQRNRLAVIAEQVERFDEVRELLNETRSQLRNGLEQLQLRKRHSAIAPDSFLEKIDETITDFLSDLDTLQREHSDVFSDDELRARIDSLFVGKIGAGPQTQSFLDAIYEEGKKRYGSACPPGFRDIAKGKTSEKEPGSYVHDGLEYRREYGDLILWNQIIEETKEKEWKFIIFVTDDKKDDWWWIVESRGGKTIGPRPELVEEIIRKAGVTVFYMYNSERFLEFANRYLRTEVEQESIEQVKEVARFRQAEQVTSPMARYARAEQAVLEWLTAAYPQDEVDATHYGFPDFVRMSRGGGERIGYEVKYLQRGGVSLDQMLRMRLRDVAYRGFYEISKGTITSLVIVLVADNDKNLFAEAERVFRTPRVEIPEGVSFVVGTIAAEDSSDLRFTPVFEK